MKRTCLNAAIAATVFLLPLALVPIHATHPGPWVAFAAWWTMLRSQPPAPLRKMITDRRDRFSGLAIMGAALIGQLAAVVEFLSLPSNESATGLLIVGIVAITLGLMLRLWAIRALGGRFTATVCVPSDRRLIDNGPYRVVRHPSYTGALLVTIGCPLVLNSLTGALLTVILSVPAYVYRVRVEERELVRGLGETYVHYRRRTWALIPLLP